MHFDKTVYCCTTCILLWVNNYEQCLANSLKLIGFMKVYIACKYDYILNFMKRLYLIVEGIFNKHIQIKY